MVRLSTRLFRGRRAAAPLRRSTIESLEGRRLLAGDFTAMGPWYGGAASNEVGVAADVTRASREPRRAAAAEEPAPTEPTEPTPTEPTDPPPAEPTDPTANRPSVTASRPANGATNQPRDLFVAADVLIRNVGQGVDPKSLNSSTVKLIRVHDNKQVTANANTSGGGDSIVLTPTGLLSANTKYKFVVTEGVKDTAGARFQPYTSTFTTGNYLGNTLDPSVKFTQHDQSAATGKRFTGVTIGPDNRLYAGTFNGEIVRYSIGADGTLSSPLVINTVISKNGGGGRTVTGLRFDPASTAENLVLWVSHGQLAAENATDWTGKISKLSGPTLGTYQDYVTGLPRSVRDHLTNQLDFGPDGALYLTQGSNTSMGAPDVAWGMRAERMLTAAVLRVDVAAITTAVNVKTADGGTYNPFEPGAPVTLYATGVRNAYDLVWHTNGRLYTPTNGGAAGGSTPSYKGTNPAPRRIDQEQNGAYDGTIVPGLSNIPETQDDFLYRIEPGGYYGHPNPLRGEYVMNGGNPTAGADKNEVASYPVGVKPDRNYRGAAWKFGKSYSPDGIIEYRGAGFDGTLTGRLFVTRYSGGDDIAILQVDPAGNILRADTGVEGLSNFKDPLDLVEDRRNGNLYVIEHGALKITLAKPADTGDTGEVQVQPTIETQPLSQTLPEGQPVTFSVKAAGNGLRYQWQRNAIDIPGATAASYAINETNRTDDGAQFRVVVTNNVGIAVSEPATLTVTYSRPPVVTITEPAEGTSFTGGQTFTFAGEASDPDEGTLPPGAFTWDVTAVRGGVATPVVAPFSGATGGSFTVPNDGSVSADVVYRVRLTVRDSTGLVTEATRDVTPRTTDITLGANVPGVQLTLDGAPVATPSVVASLVGATRTLGAPPTHEANGIFYEFTGWSDGGPAAHAITTPDVATTYQANYQVRAVGDPPTTGGPDLTVASVVAATSGTLGRAGKATVRVANAGAAAFNAPATVELFLSSDPALSADDTPLTTSTKTLKIKAAGIKAVKLKLAYPAVPADGSYYVLAEATPVDRSVESNPGNNVGAAHVPVIVRNPVVDLTGSFTTFPIATVFRGGEAKATFSLRNAGTISADGPVTLALFVVPQGADPESVADRTPVASFPQVVKIAPAKTKRLKLTFAIPPTLAPGNYTLTASIDSTGAFAESDEANNTVIAPAVLVVI